MIANYGNAVAPIVPYIFGQTFTFRNKDGPFRVVRLKTLCNASCGLFSARFFSSVCQVSKLLPRINYDCIIHADSRLCRDAQYDSDDCFIM